MVGKVKAAINPNAVLRHLDVFLRANRPGALHWHDLALCYLVSVLLQGHNTSRVPTFALWRRCRVDISRAVAVNSGVLVLQPASNAEIETQRGRLQQSSTSVAQHQDRTGTSLSPAHAWLLHRLLHGVARARRA